MDPRRTEYMRHTAAHPAEAARQYVPYEYRPSPSRMGVIVGGAALLALGIALGVSMGPDFVRYMKIESM